MRIAARCEGAADARCLRCGRRGKRRRQDAQNLLAVLRAEPFDAAQLTAVLEAQRVRMAGRFEVGQGLMRDLLVAMTPEARQAFADRLEKRLQHDPEGR